MTHPLSSLYQSRENYNLFEAYMTKLYPESKGNIGSYLLIKLSDHEE